MIKWQNVSAGYDRQDILHDITLQAQKGRVLVLVGRNGCGKSTLLKTLLNLKYQGEILVDDKPLSQYTTQELAQKIAFLPQRRNMSDISVERMVLHGRFPYLNYPRRYRKIDYEICQKAMRQIGVEQYAHKNMKELSGGMQQNAYIAMALAQETPIIVLDEPTIYLDIAHQMQLLQLIRDLASLGKTIVLVLHDLIQALQYGDDIALMKEGKIEAYGSAEELYQNKQLQEVLKVSIEKIMTKDGPQYYYVMND